MELIEKVIKINRCTTVTKGGRKFSFSALVVVGDKNGRVGYGFGKANEIMQAKQKALNKAKKEIFQVFLENNRTIPYRIVVKFCATKIIMQPASSGRGIVAGNTAKFLLDVLGIKDIVVKSIKSNNPHNVIRALTTGLKSIKKKHIYR